MRTPLEHASEFFAAVASLPTTTHLVVPRMPRDARVLRGLRAALFHDPPVPGGAAPRVVLFLWTVPRLLAPREPSRAGQCDPRRNARLRGVRGTPVRHRSLPGDVTCGSRARLAARDLPGRRVPVRHPDYR